MSTDTYRPAKWYAAEIRKNIKAAQKSGGLDPKWQISVHTKLASMCAEVSVNVRNVRDHIELFDENGDLRTWSAEAVALAEQVRGYMAPAADWHDGRMHFLFLYFGGGLMAP